MISANVNQESVGRPEVQVQHIAPFADPALVGLVVAPALVAALLPVDKECKQMQKACDDIP